MEPHLLLLYRDICNGFSRGLYLDKDVFIKHLSAFEYAEAEEYHKIELARATKRGIPTREDKLKWLVANELWDTKDDQTLLETKDYIDGLEKTKSNLAYKSQIDAMAKTISEERARYNELYAKREKLFGLTAETVASQKLQYFYVHLSYYKKQDLEKQLFSMKDINSMDDEESNEALNSYYDHVNSFCVENIEKISLFPQFVNQLFLCGESMGDFFRKPMWQLTAHQINLLSNGLYFRNITRGEDIPDDIASDPAKIKEYVNSSKARKDLLKRVGQNGGSTGLVGAGKEDFKAMGVTDDRSFMKGGQTSLLSTLTSQ